MNYNPYDLVNMRINGKDTNGRPIAFDSDVVDNNMMTNAFGNPVKPEKLSTSCPDCGQGLVYDVVLSDPPFGVVEKPCCSAVGVQCPRGYVLEPEPVVDPFMHPVEDGRIPSHDLDPLVHDNSVIEREESSVADRVQFGDDSDTVASDQSLSEEAVTEEAVTEEVVTEEVVTEEVVTEEAVTEEAVTEEAVTEEAAETVEKTQQTDELLEALSVVEEEEKPNEKPKKAAKKKAKKQPDVEVDDLAEED